MVLIYHNGFSDERYHFCSNFVNPAFSVSLSRSLTGVVVVWKSQMSSANHKNHSICKCSQITIHGHTVSHDRSVRFLHKFQGHFFCQMLL